MKSYFVLGTLCCTLLFLGILTYSSGIIESKNKTTANFEASCRLNSFSWITKQPTEAGVVLSEKSCLGCTVDAENHFCNQKGYEGFVEVLTDFRNACKEKGDTWMFMEPTMNNIMLSEKQCWGCMANNENHFCSKDEYLKFES